MGALRLEDAEGWKAFGDTGVSDKNDADFVYVLVSSTWEQYYFDRNQDAWLRINLEFLGDQSTKDIPVGSAILIEKPNAANPSSASEVLPYDLTGQGS